MIINCLQESLNEVKAKLEEVNGEGNKVDQEIGELQKEKLTFQHQFEKYENALKENTAKQRHWKKEVRKTYRT